MPTHGSPNDERTRLIRGADGRLYSLSPEGRKPNVVPETSPRRDLPDGESYSTSERRPSEIFDAVDLSGTGGSLPRGSHLLGAEDLSGTGGSLPRGSHLLGAEDLSGTGGSLPRGSRR